VHLRLFAFKNPQYREPDETLRRGDGSGPNRLAMSS
jgi:hypothetical protein